MQKLSYTAAQYLRLASEADPHFHGDRQATERPSGSSRGSARVAYVGCLSCQALCLHDVGIQVSVRGNPSLRLCKKLHAGHLVGEQGRGGSRDASGGE